MNVASILQETMPMEMEWEGHKIHLQVLKHSLTPEMGGLLNASNESPLKAVEAISKAVVAWDLDMDGEPFPPTAENFAKLPMSFSTAVLNKVSETWQGKPKMSSESGNGLAQAAKPETDNPE